MQNTPFVIFWVQAQPREAERRLKACRPRRQKWTHGLINHRELLRFPCAAHLFLFSSS
nr:MAG TPA: hypothetical protein [Caudoviricetes sp.]